MNQKTLFFFVILCIACFATCKKKDNIVPVTGKVIDATTELPVMQARVIYNADQVVYSDENGEFNVEYNLKRFLADSISFYVSKENYKDNHSSSIVGNTQKDIFIIPLVPR